jgi:hypothetical protein
MKSGSSKSSPPSRPIKRFVPPAPAPKPPSHKPPRSSNEVARHAVRTASSPGGIRRQNLNAPDWLAGDAVLIAPRLRANSLLTGNFTGNFVFLRL